MTMIRGIYCSYCRRRYAAHACNDGMPCEHHYGEVMRDGNIAGPATFIRSEAWRHSEGYKHFLLEELFFILSEDKKVQIRLGNKFDYRYKTADELEDLFLKFLRKVETWKWSAWTQAFHRLLFGGSSATMLPGWRFRQLVRRRQKQEAAK